jgi:hypothetical protein
MKKQNSSSPKGLKKLRTGAPRYKTPPTEGSKTQQRKQRSREMGGQ